MNIKFQRLCMVSLFSACLHAPPLFAQAPQAIPSAPGQTIIVDTPGVDLRQPPPAPRPYQRLLNSHGMSCASNFDQAGCGNFWSEFRFVFGSCRTFFGQPCIPNPPHFGPGNGYGFDGPQKCCGN
jgi:hypothetical protein